jgi:hypothetical protein
MNDHIAILTTKSSPTAQALKPTEAQIQLVEEKLKSYIEAHHPELVGVYASYSRQYMEIITGKGIKKIKGNFLSSPQNDKWKKEWVIAGTFNFSYNLDQKEIVDFSLN